MERDEERREGRQSKIGEGDGEDHEGGGGDG